MIASLSYVFSGISKLGGTATSKSLTAIASGIDKGLLRFAAKFGLKASSEAFEEMAQEILNPLFENIALGYNKNGFSNIDWSEVVYAGLMALVTTGVFEGVGTIKETQAEGLQNQKAKLQFPDAESQKALVNESLSIKANELAEKLKARLDKGKTLKGNQISQLIELNKENIAEANKVKIKTAAENRLKKLGETGDISAIADLVTKKAVGEDLTRAENKTLNNSKYGAKVANEANPTNIEAGDYASYWAEIIETDIVNAEQYNKSIDSSTNTENLNRLEQRILETNDEDLSLGERMFKQRLLTTIGNKTAFASTVRNTPTAMDMLTPTAENEQTPETAMPMEAPSKITVDMSEADRARILKEKSIEAVPVVEEIPLEKIKKLENISSWEDINKLFGNKKRQLIQKIAEEFGVFKEYANSDIDISFEFSKNNFRESYHKQKINYEQFAKMFSVLDKVIENAVGIEVHNRNDAGYKSDATLNNVYVLISAFEDGNLIVPVKLEIKEFNDKQNTLYVAISLETIKKAEVSKQGTTENGVAQNSRSATISIPDLFAKINPKDKNFLKYIPDEFLNGEQIKAKREALEAEAKKYGKEKALGFTEPSEKEIRRPLTYDEQIQELSGQKKTATMRHILDLGKKLDPNLKIKFVPNNFGKLQGHKGAYEKSTNTMYLAKDLSTVEAYAELFKHEFVHSLERKKAYASFKNYLFNKSKAFEEYAVSRLATEGDTKNRTREEAINDLVEMYMQNNKGMAKEVAEREAVADFVARTLFKGNTAQLRVALKTDTAALQTVETDLKLFEEMARDDRSLFRKIIDAIKDFIASIKGIPQFKTLEQDLDYIEQRLSRVYNSRDIKNTATDSGVVYEGTEFSGDDLGNVNATNFQEDKYYARQIDKWQTLKDNSYITVGRLQKDSSLNMVGMPEGKMYFDVSKIKTELTKHGDHLDATILKGIPKLLSNPIVIAEYKEDNTINVYGTLYYHNTPVVVGVVATKGRGGNVITKIRTVHARGNFVSQITDDTVLYLNENKKETDKWFQAQGQLVPMRGTKYGFIRSITPKGELVNTSFSSDDLNAKHNTLLERYESGEITRDEYLAEMDGLYGQAVEQYGAIEKGEYNETDMPVPKAVAENKPTERFARTFIGVAKLTPEMVNDFEKSVLLGKFSYEVASDEKAINTAEGIVANGEGEKVWENVLNEKSMPSKNDIALGEKLLTQAIAEGDTFKTMQLASELADILTRAGQVVQAARLLGKMTGAGRLVSAQRFVDSLNRDRQKKDHKGTVLLCF